jgi:CHAT domain-containing protein
MLVSQPPDPRRTGAGALRAARWLIRDHAISVLPAVSSLRALREFDRRTTSAPQLPFFGIGDPVLDRYRPIECPAKPPVLAQLDDQRGAKRSAAAPGMTVASLQRAGPAVGGAQLADLRAVLALGALGDTRCELEWLARIAGADREHLRLGSVATETEVKRLSVAGVLARYRTLAFATHGLRAGDLGLYPAIALTPPREASIDDDGLLTTPEIAALQLNADLVILSACDTAAGDAGDASAYAGLARAFFYAGARSLLVTQWPVWSEGTAAFMQLVADARVRNPAIRQAEALRQAMLTFLDPKLPDRLAHPAYWAPFVLVGG